MRQAAIGALNSIGHPDMAARVAALLEDADPLVRESAVRIAGYFGYAECADAVFALYADADEAVRRAAVEHLPFLDDARAVPVLQRALEATRRAPGRPPRPRSRESTDPAHGRSASRRSTTPTPGCATSPRVRSPTTGTRTRSTAGVARLRHPAPHVRIAALESIGRD